MTKDIKSPSKRVTRETLQKHLSEQYEYDHEMLTGKFLNLEHKGQMLSFRFKKYKQDDYAQYQLQDGNTYTLPRMVVDHIKNHIYYRQYKDLKGLKSDIEIKAMHLDGRFTSAEQMMEVQKEHRCDFIPLDFTENDRLLRERNKIVEVVSSAP